MITYMHHCGIATKIHDNNARWFKKRVFKDLTHTKTEHLVVYMTTIFVA